MRNGMYIFLTVIFGIGAIITLSHSMWADGFAMLGIAVFAALFYMRLAWASIPLIASLALAFLNQCVGVYYIFNYFNAVQSRTGGSSAQATAWLNFGFSAVFLGLCAYAIYFTVKNRQGT